MNIEAGAYYRTNEGKVIGPATLRTAEESRHHASRCKWTLSGSPYDDAGNLYGWVDTHWSERLAERVAGPVTNRQIAEQWAAKLYGFPMSRVVVDEIERRITASQK